jgi:uncharacterized protein YdeI (YjbR/CyaY-like superfamily)
MAADAKPELQVLDVPDVASWEAWLEAHHATTDEGVWLRLPHKKATKPGPSYVEAVEVALCFGWIDGQGRRGTDGESSLQRMTPRRKRSVWSKVNVERAERLIAEGRMRPAGLAEIERAKADGRWDAAYDPPSTADLPADFLAALEEHPKAKAFFATLNKRNTFPVVHRLQTAVKPETRARRLAKIIEQLDRGEKFY